MRTNPLHQPLHIDEHIILVIKPAGLLAVPGRGADKQDCLSARLAAEFGEVHVVHRLDQATSGLMVFARNRVALRNLHAQFREGRVDKAYEAVVLGKPQQTSFTIDLPLLADWPHRPKQKVDHADGKPSTTRVAVLSFDAATHTSRVRLLPVTGRTHQLRVHLLAVGHPIVGDALYGSQAAPDKASHLAPRLMLHASRLAFAHPATGERLAFESTPAF
ncbi:MAG: pseudouridine synthase [Cytophagales bacterium]|nr:pseudouridine synthase [Cytophagales bacterium]